MGASYASPKRRPGAVTYQFLCILNFHFSTLLPDSIHISRSTSRQKGPQMDPTNRSSRAEHVLNVLFTPDRRPSSFCVFYSEVCRCGEACFVKTSAIHWKMWGKQVTGCSHFTIGLQTPGLSAMYQNLESLYMNSTKMKLWLLQLRGMLSLMRRH